MHGPIAKGGKAIYGAPLGILMLDAKFPRIPGDMGNATTWPFPVLYKVVRGASPERVVLNGATGLLDAFLEAATDLVAQGAEAITTNCGFLSIFQHELAAGRELVAMSPDIGAILLECTNMPPYAFALRETLGLPIYDIYSLVTWLHTGLRPRQFGPPADWGTCLGG